MKRECNICGEEFNNKEKLIGHLEGHYEEADDEMATVKRQLEDLTT